MFSWNRDLGIMIQIALMCFTLMMLIAKKSKLGKGIPFFISAIAVGIAVEIFCFIIIHSDKNISTTPVYVIGVNLLVFLLFFLYFHSVLEEKNLKRTSLFILIFFLVSYAGFALLTAHFFERFPFIYYGIELLLLCINIFLLLRQTFNSDRVLVIKYYYPFWICLGLLILYLGVAPLLVVSQKASELMNLNVFFVVLFGVNVVGYLILLIGIFYAKKIEVI